MAHSWLQRKRKGELLELSKIAHLEDLDGLLKDDIVETLEAHLDNNAHIYSTYSAFDDYFHRNTTPYKRDRGSPSGDATYGVKARRRSTLVGLASESEDPTPERSLVARTPANLSRVASRVSQADLAPSPSQFTEMADQSFQAAKTKATELWEQSNLNDAIDVVRESASSVVFIQALILFIEGAGMEWNTLSTVCVLDTPAVGPLNSVAVHFPDLRFLLTSNFWAPALLWSITNWAIPLVVSYMFNLTLRSNTHHRSSRGQYKVDPFTFNIARALLAYNAYTPYTPIVDNNTYTPIAEAGLMGDPVLPVLRAWGPFAASTVKVVHDNVPGSYFGLQMGSLVGILVSLYDAALKK